MVNFFEPENVPEKFDDRRFYYHNPKFTLRTNLEESSELAKIIAYKINSSKDPTLFIYPTNGWSAYDKDGSVSTVNFSGKKTEEPWHDPEADTKFLDVLEDQVDKAKPNVEILKVNYHINDPQLAEISATILDDMIKDNWKKGKKYL